jgi:nitrate reductase gamma subunit
MEVISRSYGTAKAISTMIAQKTNETTRRKRSLLAVAMLIPLLSWFSVPAHASWSINLEKFHASVHGQMSCQDCHEDIKEQPLHPNPEEIGKGAKDFFQPDHCLVCHEEIATDLEKGKHGSKWVKDPGEYEMCLSCHDPHDQTPIKETVTFDPARPRYEQCGACHEEKKELPRLSAKDEACMACHRMIRPEESKGAERIETICFHCHAQLGRPAQTLTGETVSLISPADYAKTPHEKIACLICHPQATDSGHGKNISLDCGQCHFPYHDEKVAHDLHALVACGTCHLQGTQPERDPRSKRVLWKIVFKPGQVSRVHEMAIHDKDASCRRCHVPHNPIGAASMILPAKSIICMPCHAATFSVGDATTILTLIVFIAGLVLVFSYVLTGASSETEGSGVLVSLFRLGAGALRALFSRNLGAIVGALFLDVLLQRRLYRQSRKRWLIHGLIFYAFAFRFAWGIIGLIGSLQMPQWGWVWSMLNKNSPVTAFAFDLTGFMIILGAVCASIRGRKQRSSRVPDLPRQDLLALGLIASIVVIGFVLEGMRTAMTGFPEGSCYAFIGYAIGRLFFNGSVLTGVYGYVWYLHAILTGLFIAYLPFSSLLHVIISPLVLLGNAAGRHEQG